MKLSRTSVNAFAAILLMALVVVSCTGRKKSVNTVTTQEPEEAVEEETVFTAIDKYFIDNIASKYEAAEFSIPFCNYASVNDSDPEDITVLGDFWILNYNQAGDTLKCVSGGNYPGKIHAKKTADGHFEVTSFEQVEDGNRYLPTAKEIFGDKFEEFQKAYSDNKRREEIRGSVLSEYVSKHKLPYKFYQDYGWPAVEIQKAGN